MISKSRRDSVGGGGSSTKLFRVLQKPTRFSGGGGGSGRIVSVFSGTRLSHLYPTSSDIRG